MILDIVKCRTKDLEIVQRPVTTREGVKRENSDKFYRITITISHDKLTKHYNKCKLCNERARVCVCVCV